MAEQQTATCPECYQMISPEDTIVFGHGRLGHLDCRRPRVLSAEERAILLLYCRHHTVAQCVHCGEQFRLPQVGSLDSVGIRSYACPRCRADLTDSIRAHLHSCAGLPAEVQRCAAAARDAARSLVKRTRELDDAADVAMREAETALYELRLTVRRLPNRLVSRVKEKGWTDAEDRWPRRIGTARKV